VHSHWLPSSIYSQINCVNCVLLHLEKITQIIEPSISKGEPALTLVPAVKKKKKKTVDDIQKLIHSFPLYSTPPGTMVKTWIFLSLQITMVYPILQTKSGSLSPNLTLSGWNMVTRRPHSRRWSNQCRCWVHPGQKWQTSLRRFYPIWP
jgi:hypothetical protein